MRVTHGGWKRWLTYSITLFLVWLLARFYPALAVPLGVLCPLLSGPLLGGGEALAALLLPLVNSAGFCFAGGEPLLGACLALPACLCLAVSPLKLSRNRKTLGYGAAITVSLLLVYLRAGALLGGPLLQTAPKAVIAALSASPQCGSVLLQLVQLGVLPLPTAFQNTAAYQVGSFLLLDPSLRRELLSELSLRLSVWGADLLPSLLMQTVLIVGLFTSLRTDRARAPRGKGPAFRTLHLPKPYRGYVWFLCIAALLLRFGQSELAQVLGSLTYAAFTTVFRLVGSAVIVFLLARKNPAKVELYGLLTAALYALCPIVPFLFGVADQFLALRAAHIIHTEEE